MRKEKKSYKAFYITAVVVALINLVNLNKFNVPPGIPALLTTFAIGYCVLMPRINLLTASLVWLALALGSALFLPAAQASSSANMKLAAGISGMVVYSLSAPMILGLIVHGILLIGRAKGDEQTPAAPPTGRAAIEKGTSENHSKQNDQEQRGPDQKRWAPPGYYDDA